MGIPGAVVSSLTRVRRDAWRVTQPRVGFFPFAKALVVSGDAGVELSLGCIHGGQLGAIQGAIFLHLDLCQSCIDQRVSPSSQL